MRQMKGFTLIEIMIVVAIIAILTAIAVPVVLRSKVNANDAYAKQILRTISSACEWYANANNGQYPTVEGDLLNNTTKYLNQGYCGLTVQGFDYTCDLNASGYSITAVPVSAGITGTATLNIKTGGVTGP